MNSFSYTFDVLSLNYLTFQSFDFERTWCRLFQKRVVRTKFYIYVFIMCYWWHRGRFHYRRLWRAAMIYVIRRNNCTVILYYRHANRPTWHGFLTSICNWFPTDPIIIHKTSNYIPTKEKLYCTCLLTSSSFWIL